MCLNVTPAAIYIAGPMTGIEEFNYPAFNAAAARLREKGYTVKNPAEINAERGLTWAEYMRRDIPELLQCDAIYLLPGWEQSKGVMLEWQIAKSLGMHIIFSAK